MMNEAGVAGESSLGRLTREAGRRLAELSRRASLARRPRPEGVKGPSARLLLGEIGEMSRPRAFGARPSYPAAARPQPVMLLPGFGAHPARMKRMEHALVAAGHSVHQWGLGFNLGPSPENFAFLMRRVRALARAHGCDHTILYKKENVAERVREITNGAMVPVVYDSVGKDTFQASLDSLQPFGLMVSFGNASGPVAPFETGILAAKGSLFLTRPTLMTYTAKRADLVASAEELFDVVAKGMVKIEIHQTYPLAETAQAHRDLEARKTTGSTVLLP